MSKRDHIEDFFKRHLDVETNSFIEEDWVKMEEKLNAAGVGAPGNGVFWSPAKIVFMMVLVALIAFLTGWLLSPGSPGNSQTVLQNPSEKSSESTAEKPTEEITALDQPKEDYKGGTITGGEFEAHESQKVTQNEKSRLSGQKVTDKMSPDQGMLRSAPFFNRSFDSMSRIKKKGITPGNLDGRPPSLILDATVSQPGASENIQSPSSRMVPKQNTSLDDYRRWTLGLTYAPEFNGTAFSGSKGFSNKLGLQLRYKINNHWSVMTGVLFNKKRYDVEGKSYKPPEGYWNARTNGIVPEWIDASCGVIDVPVTISYHQSITDRMDLLVSMGASYLLLLDEVYHYDFSQPNANASTGWSTNQNTNEGFALLDFCAGLDYHLKRGKSLQMVVYMKPPVTEIGWGNVSLFGQGIMFTYSIPVKNLFE